MSTPAPVTIVTLCAFGHADTINNRITRADGTVSCDACRIVAMRRARRGLPPAIPPAPPPPGYIRQADALRLMRIGHTQMDRERTAGKVRVYTDSRGRVWYAPEDVERYRARQERWHAARAGRGVCDVEQQRIAAHQRTAVDAAITPLVTAATDIAARTFGVPPTRIAIPAFKGPDNAVSNARWLVCALLERCGIGRSTTARVLSMNHSSVSYALVEAPRKIADWYTVLDTALRELQQHCGIVPVSTTQPSPQPSPQPDNLVLAKLPAAITHLPEPDRRAITAYIGGPLLGVIARGNGPLEYHGLYLLATQPHVRQRVEAVLLRMGHPGHVARIGYHASRIGLAVPA